MKLRSVFSRVLGSLLKKASEPPIEFRPMFAEELYATIGICPWFRTLHNVEKVWFRDCFVMAVKPDDADVIQPDAYFAAIDSAMRYIHGKRQSASYYTMDQADALMREIHRLFPETDYDRTKDTFKGSRHTEAFLSWSYADWEYESYREMMALRAEEERQNQQRAPYFL